MSLFKLVTLAMNAQRLGKAGLEIRQRMVEAGLLGQEGSQAAGAVPERDHTIVVAGPTLTRPEAITDLTQARAEIEKLQTIVFHLANERDYLREALAVALSRIPDPAEKNPKRWWQFWRRHQLI